MNKPFVAIAGIALILALLWLASPSEPEMLFGADSGAKVTGTVESAGNWTNLTTANLNTSDNSKAACNSGFQCVGTLSDYAFDIPVDATIDGIEVSAELICLGALCTAGTDNAQFNVYLSWDNGTSYTSAKSTTAGALTTTDATYTFGDSTDTWGRSWTDDEFADGTFMVKIDTTNISVGENADTIQVDYFTVTVYYTEAPAASTDSTIKVQSATIKANGGTVIIR